MNKVWRAARIGVVAGLVVALGGCCVMPWGHWHEGRGGHERWEGPGR